jgi:hypothetical protein
MVMKVQGIEMRPQGHLGKTDDNSCAAKTVANDLSEVIDDKSETIYVFRLNGEPSEERVSNVTWNSNQTLGFQFDLDRRHMRVYTRCEGDPPIYQVVHVNDKNAINHYLCEITGGAPINQPTHIKTSYTAITGIPVPTVQPSPPLDPSFEDELDLPDPANPIGITLNHA